MHAPGMPICPCEHADHEGPGDAPVWAPILEVLGAELTGGFMYMFRARFEDGTVVTDDDRAALLAAYERSHTTVAES